jgi:hypothetical protein
MLAKGPSSSEVAGGGTILFICPSLSKQNDVVRAQACYPRENPRVIRVLQYSIQTQTGRDLERI